MEDIFESNNNKLTKIRISEDQSLDYLKEIAHVFIINKYVQNNYKPGIYYTNGFTTIFQDDKGKNYNRLKIVFINGTFHPIYKSIGSFSQNIPSLAKNVNSKVMKLLLYPKNILERPIILGIGGEFYSYFVNLYYNINNYKKFYGYTNNKSIAHDAVFNVNTNNIDIKYMPVFYHRDYDIIYNQIEKTLIEYNSLDLNRLCNKIDVLINLSKVHERLPDLLNKYKNCINRIIVISCNENNLKKRFNSDNFALMNKYEYRNPINNGIVSVNYFKVIFKVE